MRAELAHRRHISAARMSRAEFRVRHVAGMAERIPEMLARRGDAVELIVGTSSPIMSAPLSVNQSSCVTGCQSKPTVLRMPRATTSRLLPSAFMRIRLA